MTAFKLFFRRLWIKIEYYRRKKTWKKAHKSQISASLMLHVLGTTTNPKNGPYLPHPLHKDRLAHYTKAVKSLKKADIESTLSLVSVGDSLIDFPRNSFAFIPSVYNASIAGSWPHQNTQMLFDFSQVLNRKGIEPDFVLIGSFGNQFLAYQQFEAVQQKSLEALDAARQLFPNARIIVYGLPPVYNLWVLLNNQAFETAMYGWVLRDHDAVFLPLQKKFAGAFGLFPTIEMSIDGVHFTPAGVLEFDFLVKKAMTARAGSIVD